MRRLRDVLAILVVLTGAASGLFGVCGPFVDTASDAFCPLVLEIFYLEITTGTTATTYDPSANVSRLQMAAFLSRTVDRALLRGSRRAALEQFWTPQAASSLRRVAVGSSPRFVKSDGMDLWVTDATDDTVSRVRGSDGRLLETWTGATNAFGVVVAIGRVYAAGFNLTPGRLYEIDPSQDAGAVTTVATNLGANPRSLAFDGIKVWSANLGGSVSRAQPGTLPWAVTTVTAGFSGPVGILYDGANIWVTDQTAGTLLKLNSIGLILQTVTVGTGPQFPVFDGNDIWVPASDNSVTVVRASSGAVMATLTGNGLADPISAAFDGQRVLVTSGLGAISLWKAANLTPLGFLDPGAGTQPYGTCSDGLHFWVALNNVGSLIRF